MTTDAAPTTLMIPRAAPSDGPARILAPDEQSAVLPQRSGTYQPNVQLAIQTSYGAYYVEQLGADHLAAYYVRAPGVRPRLIGGARTLPKICARMLDYEEELLFPDVTRSPDQPRASTQLAAVLAELTHGKT